MTVPVNDRYAYVPGMSLLAEDQLRRDVAWIECEPLTKEEEMRLFAQMIRSWREPSNQWRATIAKQARERVIEAYQPIVLHVAQKAVRHCSGMELLDAVGEGNIALLEAIEDYVTKSADTFQDHFKALAVVSIKRRIWRARYQHGGLFSVPHYQANLLSRLHRLSAQFLHENGYEPSVADLADLLELSEEEVSRLQSLSRARVSESLQALRSEEEDSSDRLDLTPLFGAADLREDEASSLLKQALRDAIVKDLSPRQREAVVQVYGFADPSIDASLQAAPRRSAIQSRHLADYEKLARERLRQLLQPLVEGSHQDEDATEEEYYGGKEVASVLGLTHDVVKLRARQGRLPVKRVPRRQGACAHVLRFPKQAIDALAVQRREVSA